MPNIRSQSIGPDGIHIVASDGREVRLSATDMLRAFGTLTNGDPRAVDGAKDLRRNIADAKQLARDRVANFIETTLGAEQISAASLMLDFSEFDGRVVELETGP